MWSRSTIRRRMAAVCCCRSQRTVSTRSSRAEVFCRGHPKVVSIVFFYFQIFTEIISVESNIAAAFNLRTYADVIMQVVNPVSLVALDSVEITFKDQYMGRSEMWRLKKFLVSEMWNTLYCNLKIPLPRPLSHTHRPTPAST